MNKTTKHLYFFLILIIIPITYSITLQELIDSYDYSYSSDKINLTGITYDHNDTDNNGLYNHLIINITVDNLKGNYTFIGDVYKNNELITTISDTYYLYDGQNTIFLYYDTRLLSNGIYNLSLTIQEDYLTVFRGDYIYDFEFNNSLYEKPAINISIDSYELIDNDNDNKKEVLRINAVVDSQIEGNFEINALIGNGKTINSKEVYPITNGINNINIDFDGMEIRRERINNSKLYSISINDGVNYQFNFDYPLVYNLYDFDAEQSVLADVYSDGKIDLNDNNLSEFLEINISLDINESGIYSIELKLEDLYSDYLTKEIKEFNLDVGDQIVSFRINGIKVYNKKLNGPYILEYIRLSRDDEILDSVDKAYTTNYYSYGEFERPLMPDLLIENVEILDENNLRVEIANVGEAYAFAFNLELFDDNFDHIKEIFIDYLAPAQSEVIDHELDTSELNKLHAIIDYDNQVEEYNESNNLFTYNFHAPPILQDIKNITINETDLINIVVDATDPNGDNLVYYINDTSRFILIENIFSWQTYLGDEGNYSVNITVSDGEFNVSQKVDIEVKGVRTVPEDGMVIISDTFFFEDIYFLPNGLTLAASNITLDCNNATLVGDGSSNAIYQLNQSFNTIKNCNIMNYTIGIFFRGYQNQNSIENKILNNFIRYMAGRGIYVIHTSLTEISDNYVSYSGTGIDLDSSSEIAAINNTIQDSRVGFSIEFTSYSVLRDNLIYNNDFNFGVYCPWDIQTCYQDIDNSNKVDGKDIAYIVGQENLVLDDSSIGYVALISSKNITITNLTLRNNLAAITLINSSDINITYNSIFDNGYGIMLLDTDNTFSGGVHIYYNDILDNDYISLHNYQEEDIIAEYNWWGTADPDAIEDVIYHHNDYSGLGFVDYMPNLINPFDYTNMPPILYLIDDIKINEADLVDILVNANDIEALTYYINDSRFNQDNNEFTWQTPDRSAGVYIVNISVSDGEFNVSQLITIEVHDKCLPNWVEINETCRSNDTSIGWYNDTNSCYLTTGLVSDLDNKPLDNTYSCDFCLPVWQCDGWDSCLINDTKYCNSTIDPNSCYSQTNLISDLYLGDYSEFNPVQCDFCIPKLLNTTWTEWYNTTACLAGNYVEQERNRTQYDVNFCGEVDNATYTETRTTPCNHCIPNWMQENNQCQTNDKQLISYTDTNNCNEDENLLIDNGTYLDCNYCNYNLVNTSWSEWINETSCLTNDLQQQYRFKTEHDLNYTSCYSETNLASDLWNNGNNITHYDYRDIPCDNCTPHWMEVNTTCQTDNTKTGYFIDNNLCYSITTLESDLENKPDNNTYSCNYCTPEWINTNSTCAIEDYYNVTYEYTNTCCADTNLAEDCNIPEDTTAECDFCTPELTNTTWTDWYNITTCLDGNYVEQERNRTQYDVNFCNEINNVTYTETRTTQCNHCIPEWMQDNNRCQTDDKQLISYTDTNNCNEDENLPIDNGTYLDCNYCNYNFVNTSWSEWINETSCLTNDLQQQSRFKTEYDDNYTTCYLETNLESDLWNNGNNITNYDYRSVACDNCTPIWIEVNTTCQTDNTKIGYFVDDNGCYSITALESDLENKPDNNTYSCDYGYTFNIDLNEGWNLISIPLKLENETLPEPLKSIEGNYNQVLAYIDGKWGIYEPDGDHNSLYSINETIGFWIYMVNEDTLVVDGIESDVGINLNSGWNLIGYNSLNPSLINNILDGIDYSVVYGYDSGWKSYNIVRDTRLNSLENFEPGEGYWVKSNEKTIVHAGGVKEPSYRVFTVVENSNYILEWGDVGVFVVMDDNDNDGFFDDLTDETFEIYRSLDTNDDYELIGETNQFYGDNTIVFVDEFSNLEHGRIIYYKAKVKGTSIGSDESSIITCGMTGLECEPFGLICSFDWVCIPEADEWRVCFASMPSVIDLNPCFSYSSEPDYFGTECYTDIYLENQCGLGCVNGYCIE